MEYTEPVVWYAMRATYRRELKVKELLAERNIESFIPMRYQICVENKRKKRELIPVIHNLIFVRTTHTIIKQIKAKIPYLQYMMSMENSKSVPIVIPESKMQQFIIVAGTYDENLIYLKPEEVNIKRGTKIRIHGGILDGQEGLFVKVKGVREKRIVILIQGVIAIAAVTVNADLIEVVDIHSPKA